MARDRTPDQEERRSGAIRTSGAPSKESTLLVEGGLRGHSAPTGREWHAKWHAVLAIVLLAFGALPVHAEPAPVSAPPGYEEAAARIPPRHLALASSIVVDRASGGQSRRSDRSIHLTPARTGSTGQLWHEAGHIVAYASPEIERDWRARFWPGGAPIGQTVSRYAATNDREDFAETYKEMLEHGCVEDAGRTRFMRERVFRPGELTDCRP